MHLDSEDRYDISSRRRGRRHTDLDQARQHYWFIGGCSTIQTSGSHTQNRHNHSNHQGQLQQVCASYNDSPAKYKINFLQNLTTLISITVTYILHNKSYCLFYLHKLKLSCAWGRMDRVPFRRTPCRPDCLSSTDTAGCKRSSHKPTADHCPCWPTPECSSGSHPE